jgi:hypothetical protein
MVFSGRFSASDHDNWTATALSGVVASRFWRDFAKERFGFCRRLEDRYLCFGRA